MIICQLGKSIKNAFPDRRIHVISSATLKMMKRNFWKTIDANWNYGCSGANRRIANHLMVLPSARAHVPGYDRTQLDGNGARQTDLTAMGVPTQQKVEPSMRGVAIDLRSMRKENGKPVVWNVRGGLFDVVDSVEMCVVDTGQIDTVAIARNGLALIEQHPNSHLFETGNHTNRIVIAQHTIYWLPKKRP